MATITYERWENGLDLRLDKRASDANRLPVLDNAYVTTGRKLRKRPGTTKIAQLEAGTKGLVAGANKLQTFYSGATPIVHANSLFQANQIPGATGTDLVSVPMGFVFNGFVYCSAKYADASVNHHYLDGVVPPRVVDVNCPNSISIVKASSKIFGPDDDVTRFCATGAARDWTLANDAGFLAHGLQAEGDPTGQAVAMFGAKLAILMIDSVQTWHLDPDPALIVLVDNVGGVGTRFKRTPVKVGLDTIFLAEQGFRSITLAVFNANAQDSDIGSPIDDLVRPTITDALDPRAVYLQSEGQLWEIVGNYAWVYTLSRNSKIFAWSRYTFPWAIDDACSFKGRVFLRTGDDVYVVDRTVYTDNGTRIPVRIEMAYLDMKQPGVDKQVQGCDAVLKGTAQLQFRYNSEDAQYISDPVTISEDTLPGQVTPVEIMAEKLAPVITHELDELFELERLCVFYNT